jgi:hypothetical protein
MRLKIASPPIQFRIQERDKSHHTAPRLSDNGNEGLLVLCLKRIIWEVSPEF